MIQAFDTCHKCKRQIDLHHAQSWKWVTLGPNCEAVECVDCTLQLASSADASVFPFPDHMKAALEPYIQWRCDQDVAKFLLQQIETAFAVQPSTT